MTGAAFDGSTYRRTVLTPLRTASPSAVQDLFWLGHVGRELDDDAAIAACLKATKAFLNKEKSRPRQADVASAVLREWSRVEGVLGDPAARASLRLRLADAAPGAEVTAGAAGAPAAPAGAPAAGGVAGGPPAALDRSALRRRQVRAALSELARLRDEPELAEDLFAFLGLPVTATADMLRTRIDRVGEVNRKGRPNRERSLVDELLMHSRELLLDGDPADYRAGVAADLAGVPAPPPAAAPAEPPASAPPSAAATSAAEPAPSGPPKIDYTRRRKPAAVPQPAAAPQPAGGEPTPTPAPPSTAAPALPPARDSSGTVRLTWTWPAGVTEVFVVVGPAVEPAVAPRPSRKVTNTKYEIDGGAFFDGVAPGTPLTACSGRRDAAGKLAWASPTAAPATIAP